MKITKILSFLTYPEKNKTEEIEIFGTEIPIDEGKLSKMLSDIFVRSDDECNIPIAFLSEEGKQINAVREMVLNVIQNPTVDVAKTLGVRLQSSTTKTSGMGLLFFCIGSDGKNSKIVISRFPADEGVVAQKALDKLTVSFVEQVFLKSAHSYKAAMYSSVTLCDFWTGFAVDKQVNHGLKSIADYWITDFLNSDFKTTSAAGTKRLANALKNAISSSNNMVIKHEISSCVQLANNMPSKATTIEEFCSHFNLSSETKDLVCKQVNPARLLNEKFKFDKSEFNKQISYKLVELDNGAMLSALVDKFDKCFDQSENDGSITFTTTGQIIEEKLRKVK